MSLYKHKINLINFKNISYQKKNNKKIKIIIIK